MPLTTLKKILFTTIFTLGFNATAMAGGPPAIVSDIDQTNKLVQMNQYHVDQINILTNIKDEITAIKEAIGTNGYSAASQLFSSNVSGAQIGTNGYSDYSNKSTVLTSSNDVDALAKNILSAMSGVDRTSETIEEKKARINKKKTYVSEAVVHGLSVAINIRESVAETNKVIEQMAEISEKSSATVVDDIAVNNRIMVEVLKYVAQMGVATAINAELIAADMLNKDDTL